MIEETVNQCVSDNMDLACAFVQKTTVDKAVVEIDRHLFSVRSEYLRCSYLFTMIMLDTLFIRNTRDVRMLVTRDADTAILAF